MFAQRFSCCQLTLKEVIFGYFNIWKVGNIMNICTLCYVLRLDQRELLTTVFEAISSSVAVGLYWTRQVSMASCK